MKGASASKRVRDQKQVSEPERERERKRCILVQKGRGVEGTAAGRASELGIPFSSRLQEKHGPLRETDDMSHLRSSKSGLGREPDYLHVTNFEERESTGVAKRLTIDRWVGKLLTKS